MNMHACKTVQRTNMKNVYANGVLFIFVAPIANLTITSWTKSNSNLILTNVLHNFSRYYYRAVVHIDNYLHINGFAFTHIYLYICLVLLAGVRWALALWHMRFEISNGALCVFHSLKFRRSLRLHFTYLYILFASSQLVIFNVQIIGKHSFSYYSC